MEKAINGLDSIKTPEAARSRSHQVQVAATSFLALFAIVGLALYGLPFYQANYPRRVQLMLKFIF